MCVPIIFFFLEKSIYVVVAAGKVANNEIAISSETRGKKVKSIACS